MVWTDEMNENLQQQENQTLESLILENTNLKLRLEDANSVLSDQSSLIDALQNKQMSLVELEKMQEALKAKEQKLNQKDLNYAELKKKFTADPDMDYTLQTDLKKFESSALEIIENASKTLTGGVKNLKYTDLQKLSHIIFQISDEAQRLKRSAETTYGMNQKLLNGGIAGFELKLHDAKIQQECEIKLRKKYGID